MALAGVFHSLKGRLIKYSSTGIPLFYRKHILDAFSESFGIEWLAQLASFTKRNLEAKGDEISICWELADDYARDLRNIYFGSSDPAGIETTANALRQEFEGQLSECIRKQAIPDQ